MTAQKQASGPVTFLQKIYDIVTAPDQLNPGADTTANSVYLAFCSPGIPYAIDDLDFDPTHANGLKNLSQWSYLVNCIPNADGGATTITPDVKTGNFTTTGKLVWDVYKDILSSQADDVQMTKEQQARYDSCHNYLWTKPEVASAEYTAYRDYERLYKTALKAYNSIKITSENSTDPAVLQDWALNGSIYESDVQDAWDDWVTGGNKNEIENAIAVMADLMAGAPPHKLEDMKSAFDKDNKTDSLGDIFYPTPFIPTGFFTEPDYENSWNHYTYDSSETNSYTSSSSRNIGGKTGGLLNSLDTFGFNVRVGASYNEKSDFVKCVTETYKVEFDLVQLPLRRGWFVPELLTAPYWQWAPDMDNGKISAGNVPVGAEYHMPVYTVAVLMARNVTIQADTSALLDVVNSSESKGDINLSWGPFSLGKASAGDSEQSEDKDTKVTSSSVTSQGMSIIGFICNIVGKSPTKGLSSK